eukprot:scaffold67_cov338-Prasinococcus_capsulatus_cf.AAC.6
MGGKGGEGRTEPATTSGRVPVLTGNRGHVTMLGAKLMRSVAEDSNLGQVLGANEEWRAWRAGSLRESLWKEDVCATLHA